VTRPSLHRAIDALTEAADECAKLRRVIFEETRALTSALPPA
jgi:hypothetical protein